MLHVDMNHFFERTTILRTRNEMFHEKGCRLEKTNYGRTKWIVQRNEKIIVFF